MGLSTGGGRSRGDDPEDAPIMAEINITPLTDVFLVLLIIFMVTSSAISQTGMDVELPKASSGVSQTQPEGVIITLKPGGALKVNSQDVAAGDMGTFESVVKDALSKSAGKVVILEGDRQAFLGNVIQVMDVARKAGAMSFAIATSLDGEGK